MKKWIFGFGLVVMVLYLAALIAIPRISPRPESLGVTNGELKPCPGTPNCINTQATSDDVYEKRQPIVLIIPAKQAMGTLVAIIKGMPRTTIIEQTDTYLYAEFRTLAMRFIDDVEFYIDAEMGVIHYRSASRLGRSDLGVNGKRMEDIEARYIKEQK